MAAKDEFRVAEVQVRVVDAEGKVKENGNAVLGRNGVDWYYKLGDDPVGGVIVIMAVDLAGNGTERKVLMGG